MLFPENIFQKLGFDEVKELLKQECLSPMGKDLVDRMQFISNYDLLKKLLDQTHEFKQILESGKLFPSDHFYDLKSILHKVKVEGTFLLEDEFHKVYLSLQTVFACIHYFKEQEGLYPNIELLFKDLKTDKAILTMIDKVIDQKGKIKNNASKELADIISSIASNETEARKKITQIFKGLQNEGYTSDGQLTVREGRMVIPLLAEYKRKVKGIILDESSTGQTVFMEPAEVFELNNRIRDLEYEKRREIVRILTLLTDELRPYLPVLLSYHQLLTIIDFIRAKARLAVRIEGENPILKKDQSVKIFNARHPLLYLSFKEAGKKVVPLNAEINEEQRVIVVSGPNAGGKSVALKTFGLLQLMLQNGLLVPASQYSEFGIFKNIFVDIGDDQSLESDLSTYSAHLSHMKFFTENANRHTLILIDEFGTGTDPKFGGPIAEAVLEVLNQKEVRGVITTHYSNLKLFANDTKGIINASMMFDTAHLQPLYQLELGKPGSSYAFEIAQKIGLPEKVLKLAKQKTGHEQKRVDSLLVELEKDKKIILDTKTELSKNEAQLKKITEDTEKLKKYLEENQKKLINEAKAEAKNILANANKLIENTIAEIKEVKADKERTKEVRGKMKEEGEKLVVMKEEGGKMKEEGVKGNKIEVGSWVKVQDSDTIGQITSISKNNAEIAIGDIRSVVKLNRLELTHKPSSVKEAKKGNYHTHYSGTSENFYPQIDLRGKRGDEALSEIDKFIDKSVMLGFDSVRILHGKGDGILRKLIRDYLRKYSEIESMEDEHVDFGGAGITIVKLR
jgi:DNA mismatch repair protein MutS2